jgi:hypothetical protein
MKVWDGLLLSDHINIETSSDANMEKNAASSQD